MIRRILLLLLLCVTSAYAQTTEVCAGAGCTLQGTVTMAVVPQPTALAVPGSLAFGTITLGSSSAPQTVTFSNTTSTPLAIASVSISANYSITNNCPLSPTSLAGNTSCTVVVTFTPSAATTQNGTLTLVDNGASSPQVVTLTGAGQAAGVPVATINPTSLNFGSVATGTGFTQSVSMQNTGSVLLTISGIATSAQYSQTNNCGSGLATTISCTINVTFSPTATGSIPGTLTITDNAAGSPQTVVLSGTGTSGGGAAGWTQIAGTTLTGLCPSYSDIQGSTGCSAVESAWGSALVDNARNALVIHGGGHVDYFGTETYRCTFASLSAATCSLFQDSAHGSAYDAVVAASQESLSSPLTPTSRHDYGGSWYLPNQDAYFYYGGGVAQVGNFSDGNWVMNATTGAWTQLSLGGTHPQTSSNGSIPQMGYNPKDGCIYMLEGNIPNFWKNCYDAFAGQTWTQLSSPSGAPCATTNPSGVIDVLRQKYVCAGGGNLYAIDLTTSAVTNGTAASGCSALANATSPGMAYDPLNQLTTAWFGGSNVVTYNPTSNSCATVTLTGGPGAQLSNGTFNRFAYMPGIGGFVLANGISSNLWTLQLTAQVAAANQDFANRIAAAGVTASEGFDSAGEFIAVNPSTGGRGFWQAFGGSPIMSQDTTTYRSGGSSSLATIPTLASDQPNGYYAMGFASTVAASNLSVGKQVQFSWAQRYDNAYIKEQAPVTGGGTTFWKQIIVSWWDGVNQFNSCGNPDFVIVNAFNEEYPFGYLQCGNDGLQVSSSLPPNGLWNEFDRQLITSGAYNGTTQTLTGGAIPSVLYNCPYTGTTTPGATCAAYPVNTWATYKCEIIQGAFNSATSTITCWVSTPTSPAWRQFIYSPNHIITQDTTDVYNVLQLQPYWTARDNTQAPTPNLGTAHTWYDEVVICMGTVGSPCNIAPPQAPPAAP